MVSNIYNSISQKNNEISELRDKLSKSVKEDGGRKSSPRRSKMSKSITPEQLENSIVVGDGPKSGLERKGAVRGNKGYCSFEN